MRYPVDRNKSDSTNVSDSQLLEYGNNESASSSATSGATTFSLQDDNDAQGNVGEEAGNNVSTISEHVLFGNNNGQNSFLYMYYSRSTKDNSAEPLQRPYTAAGDNKGKVGEIGGNKVSMGSQQQWNDLSGGRESKYGVSGGSAGPSPTSILYGNGDNEDKRKNSENKRFSGNNDYRNLNRPVSYSTPYPEDEDNQDLFGVERNKGNRLELINEKGKGSSRPSSDSLTGGLLDEEWDKIYSVPNVDPGYLYSSEKQGVKNRIGVNSSNKNICNLSKTENKSSKRVRVTPDNDKRGVGYSESNVKRWSTTSSNRSSMKLSPLSPPSSRSPSTLSLKGKGGVQDQNRVTHCHQPPNNGSAPNKRTIDQGKRVSTTTSGDGIDQMSFLNGIGAFFGTPASRKISHSNEPTPEELFKEDMQGWKPRLATAATIFNATLFILSCFSMLFIGPILIDPILVGFEAEFSSEPVTCRTTNFRNGSGPGECAIPSCREGCTVDLFSCIFIDVEYIISPDKIENSDNPSMSQLQNSSSNNTLNNSLSRSGEELPITRSAILLININGCGYPPEVTCGDFARSYSSIALEYPCYFSRQNESIVVPHYSRETEMFHLTLAVAIPVGLAVFSGVSLCILVKYNNYLKTTIHKKYGARKRALREKRKRQKSMAARVNDEEDIEEDNTSISEIDEDYLNDDKCQKIALNGASKTGMVESRTMLTTST